MPQGLLNNTSEKRIEYDSKVADWKINIAPPGPAHDVFGFLPPGPGFYKNGPHRNRRGLRVTILFHFCYQPHLGINVCVK
jgi:hypothetical protein